MNNLPLISVYIPTFNREDLLIRAVLSVLNQTYKNVEVLVVNDGELLSQATLEKITLDTRVKVYSTQGRQGACVARNIAISNARGDFITGLDDDDYFLKDRLLSLYNISIANEGALCFSPIVKEQGGKTKIFDSYKDVVFLKDLCFGNCIGNQVFGPLAFFKNVGMFDESLPAWQDYDFWIRLVSSYGFMIRDPNPTYVMNDDVVQRISNSFGKVEFASNFFKTKYVFFRDSKYSCLVDYNFYSYPGVKVPFQFYFQALRLGVGFSRVLKLFIKKVLF